MKKLSRDRFDRAASYLRAHARPLEQRLFEYHLGTPRLDAVVAELARYQNGDGGFFGLEPDLRTSSSTPIATAIALGHLAGLKTRAAAAEIDRAAAPLVRRAVAYLVATLDPASASWIPVARDVAPAPHAPWWDFDPETGRTGAGSAANPSAEIVAALHAFAPLCDRAFLEQVTSAQLAHAATLTGEIEFHDLICLARLAEALPAAQRGTLVARIEAPALRLIERDAAKWDEYGAKPLWLALGPDTPLARCLHEFVQRNLDWEIERQNADGSWSPTWSWFGNYPDAWPVAAREWSGVLTVKNLRALAAYDRLER
jgi:hypothetical protein